MLFRSQRGEQLGADKYLVKSQITLEDVVRSISDVVDSGGTSSNTPIITMSSGRLPDDQATDATDDESQANDTPRAETLRKDQKKAANLPENARAAAEIDDIDTQMQAGEHTTKNTG